MGISGRRRRYRLLGSVAAALPISIGFAVPAAAAESIVLPGAAVAAVVVDLDGDGEREVARLVRTSSDGVEVDAWHHGPDGWEAIRGAELLTEAGERAAALLRTGHGENERLLALTAEPIANDQFGAMCCVSLHEVGQDSGAITLTPVRAADLDRGAHHIQAADLDGDGIDELVTHRMAFDEGGGPSASFVEVQAWRDGRYVQVGALDSTDQGSSALYGETDGVGGAELLTGPNQQGMTYRLTVVDGALRIEEARIGESVPSGDFFRYAIAIAGELIVVAEQDRVTTVNWPSGGEPREVGSLDGLGEYPSVTAIGTGADALLVHLSEDRFSSGETSVATVFDLDLREVGDVDLPGITQSVSRFLERGIASNGGYSVYPYPYIGPLPSELTGGRPSLAGGGVLVSPDGEGGILTRPMSPLAGLVPHGMAGPDAAWLAASSALFSTSPDAVYLYPGVLRMEPPGRVVLLPAENVLQPSASQAAVIGLVSAAYAADGEHLLSSPDGFAARLAAPPGTLVFTDGGSDEFLEVGATPVRVVFTHGSRERESNSEFAYGLLAILPDGRVMLEEWEGTVLREPPSLEATSATTTFELGARIAGTASAYAEVVVDGRPIEVGADGAFEALVDAPLWPVDIVLVARDPLGNETSTSVQVVGFVDYRGLPWLPIVGLLTAAVGVFALLRIPRPRAGPIPAWTDDGTLEEIEIE